MYRRHKWNNRKCTGWGYTFDSLLERDRYGVLLALQQAEEIEALECKPGPFTLVPGWRDRDGKAHRAVTFTPDFGYTVKGVRVIEDTKGVVLPDASIRLRLLAFQNPDWIVRVVKEAKADVPLSVLRLANRTTAQAGFFDLSLPRGA